MRDCSLNPYLCNGHIPTLSKEPADPIPNPLPSLALVLRSMVLSPPIDVGI